MTGKRFTLEEFGLSFIVNDNGRNLTAKQTVDRLNELNDKNEQLKSQLRIYRRIVSCSNCKYHDYDEFENDNGSYREFEVCRKGNDVTEGICKEWEEIE